MKHPGSKTAHGSVSAGPLVGEGRGLECRLVFGCVCGRIEIPEAFSPDPPILNGFILWVEKF